MQSLLTPVSPSPMGAAFNGTDKPYRKIVYDIDFDVDDSLNLTCVTLALGCQEDDMWFDDEKYGIDRAHFEAWLEKHDKLEYDDIHYVSAHDGEAVEMGEAHKVSFTQYIANHLNMLDVITYMKDAKIIPDYIIDQSLITINSI